MKKLACLFVGMMMCLSVAACDIFIVDKLYPVRFDDIEILVGKTKVSMLLDNGFTLKEISGNQEALGGEILLEKNSYFSGLRVLKDDVQYATISIISGNKDMPLSEATIAKIRVNVEYDHAFDRIYLDGVVLTELTPEVFQQHIQSSQMREDRTRVFCVGNDYTYDAYYEDGNITELTVSRYYKVQHGT